MTENQKKLPAETMRLAKILGIVAKEVENLLYTRRKIDARKIDLEWASTLATTPDEAEIVDAFVSRFSRLQDTLEDKLIPVLLRLVLEPVGSVIDNLNRAEKLGWLSSVDAWQDARLQRNRLAHECLEQPEKFLAALLAAMGHVELLVEMSRNVREYARAKLAV